MRFIADVYSIIEYEKKFVSENPAFAQLACAEQLKFKTTNFFSYSQYLCAPFEYIDVCFRIEFVVGFHFFLRAHILSVTFIFGHGIHRVRAIICFRKAHDNYASLHVNCLH